MKSIYIMRHGQTLFNKQLKIQGWCDSPLTPLGIKQAEIASKYFKDNNINFDDAYSSTSERASDTLEIVTDMYYKRLKGIKEWNFGALEGEPEHIVFGRFKEDTFIQYGGESENEFTDRVITTIENIAKTSSGDKILIVCHGMILHRFSKYWEKHSDVKQEGGIPNCTILKYDYNESEFILKEVIQHDFSKLEM